MQITKPFQLLRDKGQHMLIALTLKNPVECETSPIFTVTRSTCVPRITYYEYDGFQRLIRIRDQDYNILKTIAYQYQATAGCGSGCYAVAMQTFAGSNKLSYPVGVFNVHGKLLGNVTNGTAYISLWNSDTANNHLDTLAAGTESMHFNLSLSTGQNMPPGVIGRRYYQRDIPWTNIDAIGGRSGAYVNFGDGTGLGFLKLLHIPSVSAPTIRLSGLLYSTHLSGQQFKNYHDLSQCRPYPLHIGHKGNMQEWYKDFEDVDPHHWHVSHLFGLYPGHEISPLTTPEWAAAARKMLELRGDESTGWSKAWKTNFWARLRDGNHAYSLLRQLLHATREEDTNYGWPDSDRKKNRTRLSPDLYNKKK
jgi:hypothetical protein